MAITNAGNSGFGSAGAIAAATVAMEQVNAGKTDTVAESFAAAAARNSAATAAVLARAASQSRSCGKTEVFARSQVRLFQCFLCGSEVSACIYMWCTSRIHTLVTGFEP